MADFPITFQSDIHSHAGNNLTQYALFMGGLNVTNKSLEQYDPLKTGFYRLFMVRKPLFLDALMPDRMKKFKHILEYANTAVTGNTDINVNFSQLQGGYANKSMEIPNIATDDANELTIRTYEFSGSPVREVIQMWINGVTDIQTGLSTYYKINSSEFSGSAKIEVCQANHTAEFIYVVTDQTGVNIEYAAMFANCFPKQIRLSQFDSNAGEHALVEMDIAFTCTRYISPDINKKAKQLLAKYNILMNSLNFYSGITVDGSTPGSKYNIKSGKLEAKPYGGGDGINDDQYVVTQGVDEAAEYAAYANDDAANNRAAAIANSGKG